VKFTLTRQQMFSLVGYRGPTVHRIQLGADAAESRDVVCDDHRVNRGLLF
jgi:xanthine dehydrogenase YagR molybdenum-binding subunit